MILALLAMFSAPGADVAAGPSGLGVDETGIVVKIVEGPALLKIVLGGLSHQHHLYWEICNSRVWDSSRRREICTSTRDSRACSTRLS
jgi:hypothetical protein